MISDTATELEEIEEIVLASGSPRRLELLRSLGLRVEVVPSGYPEEAIPGASATELAISHAAGKVEAVAAGFRERLVIAADTVVEIEGDALGKPRSIDEAIHMLNRLSGKTHHVHTAFALAYDGRRVEASSTTAVRFYQLSLAEITRYVATGESFDKAGAYGIQAWGASLVERIDGDFYTVMGFPIAQFIRALPALGLTLVPPQESLRI